MTERYQSEAAATWSGVLRAAQAGAPEQVDVLDAEYLLAFVLGRSRAGLYARLRDPVESAAAATFAALWQRRCAGEPYAYLVGEREFYGRRFMVNPAVLIPRAATETLLEAALQRWPEHATGIVVDAGTGSGALALSFQLERPHSTVIAVDYSAAALAVAQHNARQLGTAARFWRGDWLHAMGDHSAAMVLSNPPYLAADDAHLPGLLASGEPLSALCADDAGLADLRQVAIGARRVLVSGGWLLMEHGWTQGAQARALLTDLDYTEVLSERDLSGHERVTGGRAPLRR